MSTKRKATTQEPDRKRLYTQDVFVIVSMENTPRDRTSTASFKKEEGDESEESKHEDSDTQDTQETQAYITTRTQRKRRREDSESEDESVKHHRY